MPTIVPPTGHDDHLAINAALAKGLNTTVQLTDGTYDINGSIMTGNGHRIFGEGPATVLKRHTGFLGIVLDTLVGAKDVQFMDFKVDDQAAAEDADKPSTYAVRLQSPQGALVSGIEIVNTYRLGLFLSIPNGVVVENCRTDDAHGTAAGGGHGFVAWAPFGDDGVSAMGKDVRISRHRSANNDRTGIYCVGIDGLTIEACHLENNAPTAFEQGGQIGVDRGCKNVKILGNHVTGGFASQGIEIDVSKQENPLVLPPVQHLTIMGNTVTQQGYAGITVWTNHQDAAHRELHATIMGNVLVNNNRRGNTFYAGIDMWTSLSDFTIVGNHITDDMAGCPAIRTTNKNAPDKGPSNRYTIQQNHITLTNHGTIGARTAIDEFRTLDGYSFVGPNMVTINGRHV